MRISNLSSTNIDIDTTVKKLMQAESSKYNSMLQKQTLLSWKKEAYNSIRNTIKDARNNFLNFTMQDTLSAKKISSSNDSIVTASVGADSPEITHELIVSKLASGVKKISSTSITTGTSKETLASQFGVSGTFDIKITNGTSNQTITVDTSKSIYEFVNQLKTSGINITASYDINVDRFFLYTKNTGENSSLSFDGSSAAGLNFLNKLKLNTASENGINAELSLDGINLSQESNQFTISGVNYWLKGIGGTTTNPINLTVTSDIEKTVTKVKEFIEQYNKLLDSVNTSLTEEKYSDYLPLTSDQKEAMSETEIETWEKKAKSGTLNNDSILNKLYLGLRSILNSNIKGLSGKYTSAMSIGINTGAYTEKGKLYLDETKLRKALAEDPEAAYKILGINDENDNSKDGIVNKMMDKLKLAQTEIETKAGKSSSVANDSDSTIAKQIISYEKLLTREDTRLEFMQTRYYKEFSSMEEALNKIQNQTSWISQMLGG